MTRRFALLLIGLALLTGCGETAPLEVDAQPRKVAKKPKGQPTSATSVATTEATSARVRSPAEPLSEEDFQRLLRLVAQLPGGRVPEFTPADESPTAEGLTATQLVEQFRQRFHRVFDARRQGQAWDADPAIHQAARANSLSTSELAGIVRSVSCAVMRNQIEEQHNIGELCLQCQQEIQQLIERIQQIDGLPAKEMNSTLAFHRTQSMLRLGRMVALLEFAELMKQVPPENLALIRRHQQDLASLVPPPAAADPFADPFATTAEGETDTQQR